MWIVDKNRSRAEWSAAGNGLLPGLSTSVGAYNLGLDMWGCGLPLSAEQLSACDETYLGLVAARNYPAARALAIGRLWPELALHARAIAAAFSPGGDPKKRLLWQRRFAAIRAAREVAARESFRRELRNSVPAEYVPPEPEKLVYITATGNGAGAASFRLAQIASRLGYEVESVDSGSGPDFVYGRTVRMPAIETVAVAAILRSGWASAHAAAFGRSDTVSISIS